jgi:hypothetical protein
MQNTETRGSYMIITEEQVKEMCIPDFNEVSMTALVDAFERVRHVEFPPFFEQFENPTEARKIIDRSVLSIIGYNKDEIDDMLPKIYRAIATELRSWKELMHQPSAKGKDSSSQMHLFAKE